MYPNRLFQYTKKDFYSEEKEFTITSSTKYDARFNVFAMPVTGDISRRSNLSFSKW